MKSSTCPKPFSSARRTLRAIGRYWYLVLICAVLGGRLRRGVRFQARAGLHRDRATVGDQRQRLQCRALAGSLQAAQELASTFARVVQSTEVANRVAKALHTTPAWAIAHLSGTPVPTSPFVMISANAGEHRGRPDGGERGAEGRRRRTRASSSARPRAAALLPRFAPTPSSSRVLRTISGSSRAEAARRRLVRPLAGNRDPTTPDPRLQHQIEQATADCRRRADAAQRRAVRVHCSRHENQLGSRQTVTSSRAVSATNDRKQVAQIAILFGLLVGLLIGVACRAGARLAKLRARPEPLSWPVGSAGSRRRWR